jgi:glycosyltransferase involved in cell wall biosynthesis
MSCVKPKVTIIIPNRNTSIRFLEKSLSSVISQTYTEFECIVVDESDDQQLAQECSNLCNQDQRIVYIQPPKKMGLANSLNLAISVAKGQFIARFDADDICDHVRIERQLKFLEDNPEIGVVGSWIKIINNDDSIIGVREYKTRHHEIENEFIYKNGLAHPTVMIRREIFGNRAKLYNEKYKYSEDLELWLRLLSGGVLFANIPEYLVSYRQQNFYRFQANWLYNIRARLAHLQRPKLLTKLLAIFLLFGWAIVPKSMQSRIYEKSITK